MKWATQKLPVIEGEVVAIELCMVGGIFLNGRTSSLVGWNQEEGWEGLAKVIGS